MMLIRKNRLFLVGLIAVVLTWSMTSASTVVSAHIARPHVGFEPANGTLSFEGTWHWMFRGKSFATMTLTRSNSGFTGSVTESRIALRSDGNLGKADASPDTTPKQIAEANLRGHVLRVVVKDGFKFNVVLKDASHAEIHPIGAPARMKPIPALKAE